jgi:hypothetical protein
VGYFPEKWRLSMETDLYAESSNIQVSIALILLIFVTIIGNECSILAMYSYSFHTHFKLSPIWPGQHIKYPWIMHVDWRLVKHKFIWIWIIQFIEEIHLHRSFQSEHVLCLIQHITSIFHTAAFPFLKSNPQTKDGSM